MAIAASHLTAGAEDPYVSPAATASVSPGSGNLVLVAIGLFKSSGSPTNPASVVGNGITYALVAASGDFNDGFGPKRTLLYRGLSASPSAGAITITGGTFDLVSWAVSEVSGVDDSGGSNGSAAVVQSAVNQNGSSATSLTITLGAFGSVDNGAFACGYSYNGNPLTPEAGWTELFDGSASDEPETMWRATNDTTPSWTFSSDRIGGVAIEIKASGGGGGRTLFYRSGIEGLSTSGPKQFNPSLG